MRDLRRSFWLPWIPAALGLFLGYCWLNWPPAAPPEQPYPQQKSGVQEAPLSLEIPAEQLEMPVVWDQRFVAHQLTVRNTGERPIQIVRAIAGCNCTRISPAGFTLDPGRVQAVDIAIDLDMAKKTELSPTESRFSTTVVFEDGLGHRSVPFPIEGRLALWLSANRELRFPSILGPESVEVARDVLVNRHPSIPAIQVEVDPAFAAVELLPVGHLPDATLLRVTPVTAGRAGKFRFPIVVTAEQASELSIGDAGKPSLTIWCHGAIAGEIDWRPAEVTVVSEPRGVHPPETVIFSTVTGQPITSVEVLDAPSFVTATAAGNLPEDSDELAARLTVSAAPGDALMSTGMLTVKVSTAATSCLVNLPVTLYRVRPRAEGAAP